MNNQEYDQQKRECWEECAARVAVETENLLCKAIAYSVFDRAYALGREKETIAQEEIEKAAIEYVLTRQQARHNAKKEEDATMRDFDKTIKAWDAYDMEQAFEDGANFALGKQEKDAEESSLWSRLTDEEKRELRCRYHTNECVISNHRKLTGDKAQTRAVARMRLLESLFGKENLKTNNND